MPTATAPPIPESVWQAFEEGSRQACARVVTRVENEPDLIPSIRQRLAGKLGKAIRIGITGPPGVGKSSLTAAIARGLAEAGHRVGIIAVDPSSPFTGGAFMGDRVRMDSLAGDSRIYIRSLASRDGHGGLSPATPHVAEVIEGFGMDRILIETVGVGQAEIDVLACADLVVLVLQPGTGDMIQTLKAGIIEAADLIVVNKSDLPGVDSVVQSLRFLFSLSGPLKGTKGGETRDPGSRVNTSIPQHPNSRTPPPLLTVSAQRNEGIDKLVAEIQKLAADLVESGRHRELRRERLAQEIREGIRKRLWRRFAELTGVEAEIEDIVATLLDSGDSPYAEIDRLCERVSMHSGDKSDKEGPRRP
ncbi:MAG TPA: methylmalonyl Co-A mutase-associated GTPase MeaB [Fimbriimonadaceae bacterium]|nr:methylmalonyl Co-A mutase-associated GTPase MeaB [Fimbriimonadaceae bacterium]